MSWLVGALQTFGSLADVAGTVSNIVYQQRQAAQLEKQNELMETWMNKQEALQKIPNGINPRPLHQWSSCPSAIST